MNEFHDKGPVMKENANPPTTGFPENIERDKLFMSGVKGWKGFNGTVSGVGDKGTVYECNADFIATSGQPVHMEQVVVAKWKNGKIVQERFSHDASKRS
jgi:hypothetical protein